MADPRRGGAARGARRPTTSSGGRPPAPKAKVDPPRAAAYDVLKLVRLEDAYTNLVLPHVLAEQGLSGRDAAFVTELVSGTIRRQGTYDAIIRACLDRPKVEAKVLDALRLGTHQLLSMRVPTHAAISTTVDLVRARVGQGPAGFTNAVLRRVTEHDLDEWIRLLAPADTLGFATIAHSHPRWVVEQLGHALAAGKRREELDALLAADNASPKVTLVARPGLVTVDELTEAGGEATGRTPYAVALPGGDPGAVEAVAQGRAGVQDEGSQAVALAWAAAPVEGRDERWLDACAGPGGKSALVAAVAAGRDARLLASERQEHRAGLVRRATAQVGAGMAGIVVADGTRPAWAPGTFDRVLVDVPCSGLGALRRRPESRWRRTPEDVAGLVPLQRALLEQAVIATRAGGVVGYVTCSPVMAETREVVEHLLATRDDVELLDAPAILGSVPGVHLDDVAGPMPGTVQLWPHRHQTDAMFLALLRRR
ncbi:RsmB/NOP family class I SAM-dependent RNA methyltransferase [Nocardioides sp. Soil796]|uniref:RsmB/NOP family class I SAM-dependent RNA methyltransferase n=1 Tax=Nocardioides sp. Soil796 TaxID=1736412 RepID=UPI00070E2C76|nr:transcription antitermination factor NusB [Nocardioides sp. Soil796]KRF16284.1 rRNA cytosine-C5-methyltransferase [Nocardioides sp. Soil796]